jgi:hydroxyacylglutathione hydrolase
MALPFQDFTSVEIARIPSGPFQTNSYVVFSKKTKEAIIIDASFGSYDKIVPLLKQREANAKLLFLTHSHWDHIADASLFAREMHLPIAVHVGDIKNLMDPGSDGIPSPVPIQGVAPSISFEEGYTISLGDTNFRVIHTPGHSPGCVCLYSAEVGVLFSGDTLFRRSYGNLQLPTGEPGRMRASLQKLGALPLETTVFPGHGGSTTIGEEIALLRTF